MVELWVPVVVAIVSGALGYLGHFIQARGASKDTRNALHDARRAEVLDHMRWAMERVVSTDQGQRRLGAGQLTAIANSEYLEPEDKRRIRAAIHSSLASVLEPWDTEHTVEAEEGEQA